jgi:hypothetical protein
MMRKLQIMQITEFVEQHRRNSKDHTGGMSSDWIAQKFLKYQAEKKNCRDLSSNGRLLFCNICDRSDTGKDVDSIHFLK